jgi:hypothetical protein
MCKWGTCTEVTVWTPAELSHNNEGYWGNKKIDSCIASLVKALNDAGIWTVQACCAHGKGDGAIDLIDGRRLIITDTTLRRFTGPIKEPCVD